MKTVVSQEGGIIECRNRDILRPTLAMYMAHVAGLIDGKRLVNDDRGDEIIYLDDIIFLSTTAAIAAFGIRLTLTLDSDAYEQQVLYTRFQFVFFQVDPESPRWDWKHLVSFDSRGAGTETCAYGHVEKRKLIFLWKLEKMDNWQFNLPIVPAWRDGEYIGPILEARIVVRQTHEMPGDNDSQLMFSAKLVP